MSRFRLVIDELKTSLQSGGINDLAAAHAAGIESCRSYRVFCRLLELAYPVDALLGFYEGVDAQVAELGLAGASDAILDRLPTSWQVRLPPGSEERIHSDPIVVFGRHGSVLTPFLIAAAIRRPDMKMLAATYVAKLGPHVADCTYTVHIPRPTLRRAARKGILLRVGAWLTAKIDCQIAPENARAENRAALSQAAEHVRNGGSLLIAPDATNPRARWRSGIGHLIAQIANGDPGRPEVFLVPYRIWASLTGLFHLLSQNPLLRVLGRWQYRHPIRVAFGKPLALSDVLRQTGLDPAAITEFLESYYHGLGF